jgi:hypothetical protein
MYWINVRGPGRWGNTVIWEGKRRLHTVDLTRSKDFRWKDEEKGALEACLSYIYSRYRCIYRYRYILYYNSCLPVDVYYELLQALMLAMRSCPCYSSCTCHEDMQSGKQTMTLTKRLTILLPPITRTRAPWMVVTISSISLTNNKTCSREREIRRVLVLTLVDPHSLCGSSWLNGTGGGIRVEAWLWIWMNTACTWWRH